LNDPALGLLESGSIAAGIRAVDEVIKKAVVHVLQAAPVSPGKYLILFAGSEEPVNQSCLHGAEVLGDWLLDRLFIPNIHPQIIPVMQGTSQVIEWDAVGVVETSTAASTIIGADSAVKNAEVALSELQLARGIGGKGFFVFTGSLDNVEAGIEFGCRHAEKEGKLLNSIVIPNPDKEFYAHMM
jgi:microcompartment protein CcmL/EutN